MMQKHVVVVQCPGDATSLLKPKIRFVHEAPPPSSILVLKMLQLLCFHHHSIPKKEIFCGWSQFC